MAFGEGGACEIPAQELLMLPGLDGTGEFEGAAETGIAICSEGLLSIRLTLDAVPLCDESAVSAVTVTATSSEGLWSLRLALDTTMPSAGSTICIFTGLKLCKKLRFFMTKHTIYDKVT